MGKKRIAQVGEQKGKKGKLAGEKERPVVKTGKEHGRITDVGAKALAEAALIEEKAKKLEAEVVGKTKKEEEKKKVKPAKKRGQKYQQALKKVDRKKLYPIADAVKLLKVVSISKFNGSVDIHLLTKKTDLKGEIEFPHNTGKKQNIRIADEELLKELEKGKINFTTLIASPAMMPKLAKYARVLGPRGLMPNPKAGTITDKPEEFIKKLSGKIQFKTEQKAPLIHLSIGKVDFPEKSLVENFKAIIKAIERKNILKAVISPSMGPGIKIDLKSL